MTEKPIRILHALGTLDAGGVETWLLNVWRNIDRRRFQFDFCTFGTRPGLYAAEVEKFGAKVLRCPKGANLLSFSRRFRRILREGSYDVVHSHVFFFSGAVLRWASAEGVPVRIAHSHGTQDDKRDTPYRWCYLRMMKSWVHRYATNGLAVSRPAAAKLFGENWQMDPRYRVLYCGIDLDPFRGPVARHEVRRELGLPPDAPVVGHVGSFIRQKNHDFFLEVASEVLKRRPEVHFLLVGDGPLRREIKARAMATGLSGNMHFAGTRTDVPRLMRGGMDVFLFPSLWEGLPIALIEAQAAGLHCLASSSIANEAAARSEGITFVDLSANSSVWAEQLVQLLDRNRVDESTALEIIGKAFSIQDSMEGLAQIYQRE